MNCLHDTLVWLLSQGARSLREIQHPRCHARFLKRIAKQPNGCWLWVGATDKEGYGSFWLGEKMGAHKAAFLLFKGEIPEVVDQYHGNCVCHTCDTRLCVNPAHLFLGTHTDNMRDMVRKGRKSCRRGEDNNRTKLSIEVVLSIRCLLQAGWRQKDVAAMYSIPQPTISDIHIRKTWAHL